MSFFYGDKGNYIMLAKKFRSGAFVKSFSASFKKHATIKTKSIKAPLKWGVNRSDHHNYWKLGYDALMITNTADYRNPNYHKSSDTMETLDIPKMMEVIDATALAITNLE
jgi:Peptidase family M28.